MRVSDLGGDKKERMVADSDSPARTKEHSKWARIGGNVASNKLGALVQCDLCPDAHHVSLKFLPSCFILPLGTVCYDIVVGSQATSPMVAPSRVRKKNLLSTSSILA